MRVTNQMVTANTMSYLNSSQKSLLNLQQQLTTGKKIAKPSDDPITAVRGLKLKTDVSEIEQYERNVDDAISWIDVTEQSLTNMTDMYKRMRELSVQGASDTYTYEDQVKILEEIKQLTEQLAHEGNVTYAGRHVFTGFKTDTQLIYDKDVTTKVEIQEQFDNKSFETKQIILGSPPMQQEIYRIRLAYQDGTFDITTPINELTVTPTVPVGGANFIPKNSTDVDAYNPPAGSAYVLQDTGEIIFNQTDAQTLMTNPTFDLKISYDKNGFKAGEQVPQNYYKSDIYQSYTNIDYSNDGTNNYIRVVDVPIKDGSITNITLSDASTVLPANIVYTDSSSGLVPAANEVVVYKDTGKLIFGTSYDPPAITGVSGLDYQSVMDGSQNQYIEYEISINQTMKVNTLGKDVLTTDALRDLQEIIYDVNNFVTKIEEINNDSSKTEEQKTAEIKVYQDLISDYYDKMISNVDSSIKQISNETSIVGSKGNRLELTGNRLADDKINFTELLSKTEDIDLTETVIKLQSQQVVYNSALMATSKIIQPTLLEFLR